MTRLRIAVSINLITAVLFLYHSGAAYAQNISARVTTKPSADDTIMTEPPVTDEEIQLLRKDIRFQQKQIIAMDMKLTDAEAEKFWRVYEEYISDVAKIDDAKYQLVKQYVYTRGALTDTEAESAVKQWPNIDQSLAQLNMRYIPIFRKILSPKNTALFYQVYRRIQLMIDLRLAFALPLIEP